MIRIFYFSGYRLSIFHWERGHCSASYIFDPGEDGIERFTHYLKKTDNTPVRLLVDLIEEDFNTDTIPHVGQTDRTAIIKRLVDRHYRKSKDFIYHKVLGREKSGRKDDIILYSVLSNPDILEPWLKPVNESGTAISGIWSLPLLTQKLYKHIDPVASNILLVSQQVPSNLRQTFIKNGHFESSRSAVVNLAEAPLGEFITSEVEQTIRFLSNQRHIGFDEKIEIHVICRNQDIDQIKTYCIDSAIRSFHYHNLRDILESLNCEICETEYCSGLFSYLCADQSLPIGHYGNKSYFKEYYQNLASTAIYTFSIILLVASLIYSFGLYSNSISINNEINTLTQHTQGINNEYRKSISHLEPKLKQTQLMQSAVSFVERVKQSKSISPQNFMSDISKTLSHQQSHAAMITRLGWRRTQNTKFDKSQDTKDVEPIDYGLDDPIYHFARFYGFLDTDSFSIKESVSQLDKLTSTIKKNKQINNMDIIRMPIDIRSNTTLEHTVKNKTIDKNSQDNKPFEIKIIMKARES